MPGPAPKPPSRRRQRRVPASYGLASPTVAPGAAAGPRDLGIDEPHHLIVGLWTAVQESCESRYFSEADFARLRLECWYANQVMKHPTAAAWSAVQAGLNACLISPIEKRRVGIEVKPVDSGEDAAVVLQIARYQEALKSE